MISQSCKATDRALSLAIHMPIQYQTFLPLPSSLGARLFFFNSWSNFFKPGPSFHRIEKGDFNFLKNFQAFFACASFALSNPIIMWSKYFVLLISSTIFGKAVPSNSE